MTPTARAALGAAERADVRQGVAVQRAVAAEVRAHRDHRRAPVRPIRVLVVDDLAPLRRLLVRQLVRAGHVVVGEAATAAEALAHARTLFPDVVLLDVHLPDGLGTDVAARLLAGDGAAPWRPAPARAVAPPTVVFCTGDLASASPDGVARAGAPWAACPVLEKPVAADALDHTVREAASRRHDVS